MLLQTSGAQGPSGEFWFDGLTGAEARAVRAAGVLRSFATGQDLLCEDGEDRGAIVIEHGFVKVLRVRAGREVVLSVGGPGELLGEVSLLDDRAHAATARALTPVQARHIPPAAFWDLVAAHPAVGQAVICTVTARLRETSHQRCEQLAAPAVLRLAARLLLLADRHGRPRTGEEIEITAPLSQAELSSWCGVTEKTGARALRQLRDAGWIRAEHRCVVLRDHEAIRRFAGASVPAR